MNGHTVPAPPAWRHALRWACWGICQVAIGAAACAAGATAGLGASMFAVYLFDPDTTWWVPFLVPAWGCPVGWAFLHEGQQRAPAAPPPRRPGR